MNSYIDAQCRNLIAVVNTFENACALAVRQDDGKISKSEEKALKQIKSATKDFKVRLEKVTAL